MSRELHGPDPRQTAYRGAAGVREPHGSLGALDRVERLRGTPHPPAAEAAGQAQAGSEATGGDDQGRNKEGGGPAGAGAEGARLAAVQFGGGGGLAQPRHDGGPGVCDVPLARHRQRGPGDAHVARPGPHGLLAGV